MSEVHLGGYYTDIIHKLDEFKDLPWYKLKPDRCGFDWSFGRGGHGFDDWTWTINYIENGDTVHFWELPQALTGMFKMVEQTAADEARRKIRCALGV